MRSLFRGNDSRFSVISAGKHGSPCAGSSEVLLVTPSFWPKIVSWLLTNQRIEVPVAATPRF